MEERKDAMDVWPQILPSEVTFAGFLSWVEAKIVDPEESSSSLSPQRLQPDFLAQVLELLRVKTAGNLDSQEAELLEKLARKYARHT
jgi:hypothetical protein